MTFAKFPDRKPVKIRLSLKVRAYVDVYRAVYGEAADAAAGVRIRDQMPRLRDAYLRALAVIADRMGSGPAPELERVKRALAAASARVLGDHVVNDVLIQRSFLRRVS